MKRILAMALSVLLIAGMAIGGSVAYLTSTDDATNTFVMGDVEIEQHETDKENNPFDNNQKLLPSSSFKKVSYTNSGIDKKDGFWTANNGEIDKVVTVENKGKTDAFVRTIFAFEDTGSIDTNGMIIKNVNGSEGVGTFEPVMNDGEHANFAYNGEVYNLYVFTYKEKLSATEDKITAPSLRQVAMAAEADSAVVKMIEESTDGKYTILVATQAVQAENMGTMDAEAALKEAFGEISSTNNPWVNEEAGNTEAGNVIRISSKADLLDLSGTSHCMTNVTFVLEDDIDMEGATMNMIGLDNIDSTTKPMNAKFCGNGHKISNFKLEMYGNNGRYDTGNIGLFELRGSPNQAAKLSFTVEDLTLDNVTIDSNEDTRAAIVLSYANENCDVKLKNVDVYNSNVTIGGGASVFVGHTYSPVTMEDCDAINCTIKGDKPEKTGTFAATVQGTTVSITNCMSNTKDGTNNNAGAKDNGRCVAYGTVKGSFTGSSTKVALAISTKEQLEAFAKDVNDGENYYAGKTVILTNDIDLENENWTPIGRVIPDKDGENDDNRYFQGTFDGNGHTIKNLKAVDETGSTGYTAVGLFGWIDASGATIKNLTIDGATVKGCHYTGAIVGYLSGTIENCSVKNSSIRSTHINDDDCGDKAGAVVGFMNKNAKASNCHAQECNVIAARDAGQVIGCCHGSSVTVTNCTADKVAVSADKTICNHTNAGKNINNEIVGRTNGARVI